MQGFNMGRYVPPDLEGTTSANKAQGKHALGARASKLSSQGILTVRFEMPYAIWCSTCPKPTIIGQGVRFNAEKKKVGAYYTTPIWSFRFRHPACGGYIEIRTDPKNTAYVVHDGATKRDTGEDVVRDGDTVIMTDQEREALRQNAFASLEKTIDDRQRLKDATDRIDGLIDASARHWDDTYTQNQKLRRTFRAERKDLESKAVRTEALKDRMSLGIDLLPENEADALRAALVDFRPVDDDENNAHIQDNKVLATPLFNNDRESTLADSKTSPKRMLKGEKKLSRRKDKFVSQVLDNTRASKDPFLQQRDPSSKMPRRLPGVKRKRNSDDGDTNNGDPSSKAKPGPDKSGAQNIKTTASTLSSLVEYDSE